MQEEITTIKIKKKTKTRLDNLKEYSNETYEEIIEKILEIFNLYKTNPHEANKRIEILDSQRKRLQNKK